MISILQSLPRDLRSTGRLLIARPGWTAAAILCLAIATGAATETGTRPFALREYRELSIRSDDVAMLLARTFFPLSLSAADGAQMAQAELVSGNYFDVLRVKPLAGRFFDTTADRPGGEWQGVLSHALWRRRFGADPSVIGRSMRVNGQPMVVAGVAPSIPTSRARLTPTLCPCLA